MWATNRKQRVFALPDNITISNTDIIGTNVTGNTTTTPIIVQDQHTKRNIEKRLLRITLRIKNNRINSPTITTYNKRIINIGRTLLMVILKQK